MKINDSDDRILLAEPVNAPDALFYTHGIPWHVIVHDCPTELEIQAFGGGIRTQQNICLPLAEPTFGVITRDHAPGTIRAPDLASATGVTHDA